MKRNIEIDIAKGLVIWCVIAGHIVHGTAHAIFYLFHMPFFFIVSGYLHKNRLDEVTFLKRKTVSLLLPYAIYLLIFKSESIARHIHNIFYDFSAHQLLAFAKYLCLLIWGGKILTGQVGVFWFITCLFITQQLYNFVLNRLKTNKKVLYFAILLYLCAFLNQFILNRYAFPWSVNVVCCSFIFFTIGNLYGNYIFEFNDSRYIFLSFLFSAIAIILVRYNFSLSFKMKSAYYGWFVVSPIAALSMTKVILLIAKGLSKVSIINKYLSVAGAASITIMFSHQFFHFSLKKFCQSNLWFSTFLILLICILLHLIISTNGILRLLFLGSHKDLELLKPKFCGPRKTAL